MFDSCFYHEDSFRIALRGPAGSRYRSFVTVRHATQNYFRRPYFIMGYSYGFNEGPRAAAKLTKIAAVYFTTDDVATTEVVPRRTVGC